MTLTNFKITRPLVITAYCLVIILHFQEKIGIFFYQSSSLCNLQTIGDGFLMNIQGKLHEGDFNNFSI